MPLNFLPGALEQAHAEAAGPDAVAAGLARATLEAAGGQAGARFTFRRALAQAEAPAQPGPELRRQVTAAVICQEFAAIRGLLADAFPGLDAALRAPAAAAVALPPDVLPFEMAAGGQVVFVMPESMFASPHLSHLIARWLGALPVFAAWGEMGEGRSGRSVLNLGARQKVPGVAYCSARPRACLIPDPDFLATNGHARLRRQMLSPDWAGRSDRVFWRGARRDAARVEAALAGSGALLAAGASEAGPGKPGDHRMALDLDGGAASSSALFHLLLSGAPVVRAAAADSNRIWLEARLVAWTHYVPVAADLSDLGERVGWLRAHQAEAQAVGAAGRKLVREMDFQAELRAAAQAVGAALQRL